MSLYDRSVDLQLKIEATQSADASLDLLARANRLVSGLDAASAFVNAAMKFRVGAGLTDSPPSDAKAVASAVGAFRGGVSRHGANAFQHQPASSLIDTARDHYRMVSRWATKRWKDLFEPYEPLIERALPGRLVGTSNHRIVAQARAATLHSVRGLDPIADAAAIASSLGGSEEVGSWLESIRTIATELENALLALDAEHAALTVDVRAALSAAASIDGLSLSDVTPHLLSELKAAGVDEHLVVRRQ